MVNLGRLYYCKKFLHLYFFCVFSLSMLCLTSTPSDNSTKFDIVNVTEKRISGKDLWLGRQLRAIFKGAVYRNLASWTRMVVYVRYNVSFPLIYTPLLDIAPKTLISSDSPFLSWKKEKNHVCTTHCTTIMLLCNVMCCTCPCLILSYLHKLKILIKL